MFGKLGDIMKQAKEVKENMAKAEQIAEATLVEGTSSGDFVTVTMTCKANVQNISINPVAAQDVDMLETLLLAALKDAKSNADKKLSEIMKESVGDFDALQSLLPK